MEENERIMTVKELVEDALREKKLSIARLAEMTDIPERYVVMLLGGEHKGLPPAPYVRGYLIRIAGALGLEGQILWQAYKKQLELKTSGEGDTLPSNRFAFKRVNRGKIATIAILVIVAIAGAVWMKALLGTGEIDIKNPAEDSIVTYESSIDLRGRIDPSDRLIINNEDVTIDTSGYFEKEFSLEPGINSVEFKVKRLLGKETTIVKQIIYQQ
ncbi:MAG: Transcriptional regulator [Candidatus Wolfebacteria bacterium GW2011_GWC2_46_275]|nr:MAG: Transcriptional regulator [Candidatus Wolfebacteria bacterium GW2011_GWC2_46_275]KKU41457.1 MAG: Transcriptional regulator [Candidatus Wolfebacteria bacterium GW2011_GWB2_46_69]KKU53387.1 MAG: Transcriptional regulator [Candidatus Wolfebacteria bacterium GW2011_GWC1_47_103]KKU58837.1 MAG: Transcriptional regulator [Candidatus Wolfebacteria bacterium GW2011_GWE2_47_12]KKU65422.1 MAG: Transcriptional regulator [Candidatus Wolfebacteria bacterium GW2011_GWD2_47_17]KKU71124.1 MAG: Transcri